MHKKAFYLGFMRRAAYLTEKALLSKSAHELVFGASGAGKTTKAKQLSQDLGLPIASLDDEPEWVPWVKANDKLVDENGLPFHLQEGHPKNTEWKQLMRTITDRSLSKKSPHIVEGTHLMVLSPEELKQHNLHIVNPPADQVVQQRLDRSIRSRAANGKAAHTPEELKRNQEFARAFYNKIQPTVREWQKYAELCSNSTIIPPMGNSLQNAPTAGGLIKGSADHHNAYVVRLSPAVLHSKKLLRQNPDRHPDKPAVYVGSTGLDPQERFKKHKDGLKQNNLVKQFGVELMPELYQQYNPTTFHKAEEIEKWLATKLRADGYTVAGGNEKTSGERVNEIAWKRTLR